MKNYFISVDQPLVGEHRAAVDIHADETAAARGAQGKGGAGVIAQDVKADGQGDGLADGATNRGHGGDGFGADGGFGERDVAEVLDEDRVCAALLVGAGIGDGGFDEGRELAAPARCAGQRGEVNNADEQFAVRLKEHGEFVADFLATEKEFRF